LQIGKFVICNHELRPTAKLAWYASRRQPPGSDLTVPLPLARR